MVKHANNFCVLHFSFYDHKIKNFSFLNKKIHKNTGEKTAII